jgi:hypothetical protein
MGAARIITGWRGTGMVLAAALALNLAAGCGSAGSPARAADPGGGLAAGRTGARSAVPWARVGPGWVLAQYWPGRFGGMAEPEAAAATLYLIDPAGGRYRLYRWPVTRNPPFLTDWSGDKTRALVSTGSAVEQLVLATGQISQVRLPGRAQVIGYTRPSGRDLLGWRQAGPGARLSRYRLTGHLATVLATGRYASTAVYSSTGSTLAVAAYQGIEVVSNHGGVLRTLPVPGARADDCFPSRWWNPGTILASCQVRGSSGGRLWLVPSGGRRPTALTAQRGSSGDPGDIGAWRLPGGLYVQTLGASGTARVFRQGAGGSLAPVTVPGTAASTSIVTAVGPRLLLSAATPCDASTSLLWFNPSTRREQMLIKAPRSRAGLLGAVPYGQPAAAMFFLFGCGGGT